MKGLQSVTPKHPQEPSGELEPSRETLRSSLGTGTIPCPSHLCIQESLHRHLHGSCSHHPKAEQHPVPRAPQLLRGCLFHMDFPHQLHPYFLQGQSMGNGCSSAVPPTLPLAMWVGRGEGRPRSSTTAEVPTNDFPHRSHGSPFNLRQRAKVLELSTPAHPHLPAALQSPQSPHGNGCPAPQPSPASIPGRGQAAELMLMGMKVSGQGRSAPAAPRGQQRPLPALPVPPWPFPNPSRGAGRAQLK